MVEPGPGSGSGPGPGPLLGLPERRFLPLVLEFNFLIAATVHDSWLASSTRSELLTRLRERDEALSWLSRFLIESLELPVEYSDDFSCPLSRVALLEPPELESLCLHVGLALNSDSLRRELSGERVRLLKQTLGERVFSFALKRAPLLGAPPTFECEPDSDDPHQQYLLTGARWFSAKLADRQDLRRRMVLKFPADWSGLLLAEASGNPFEKDREPMTPWLRKLINEAIPEWNPLFA